MTEFCAFELQTIDFLLMKYLRKLANDTLTKEHPEKYDGVGSSIVDFLCCRSSHSGAC